MHCLERHFSRAICFWNDSQSEEDSRRVGTILRVLKIEAPGGLCLWPMR